MGLVLGKWRFADASQLPATQAIANGLTHATGLRVSCSDSGTESDERIDIPFLRESLFDIERIDSAITLCGYIPAHPYLWENLDRVLSELGGKIELAETHWRPNSKYHHLRRPWQALTPRQRFLLRLPTLGASRLFDRFV